MVLKNFLGILRARWVLILVTALLGVIAAASAITPRTEIKVALGLLVGLVVGVGLALLGTLDTRIKSIEKLTRHFDQPLLGIIGYEANAAKRPLIVQDTSHSKRSQSLDRLRANLQFVGVDHRPRSIVVSSSMPGDGKSTTAINLAITIAQTGQPVFLIEGVLRLPMVAEYLGIERGPGLTDVLVGRATIDEVVQPWGDTGNLWVLTAGALPPNPSELLGSQAMADLIHHLEKRTTVIVDAPPLLPVPDAAVLTKVCGGAILIVRAGKTRREHLRSAESRIEDLGGRILGLVFNMAPAKSSDSYRDVHGYQFDYSNLTVNTPLGEQPPVNPAGLGSRAGVNGSSTVTGIADSPRSDEEARRLEAPGINGVDHAAKGVELGVTMTTPEAPLQQVPGIERVIGHSMKVPLPPLTTDEPVQAFEPDPIATDAWTPPKPRPAFDPLTAPMDDVEDSL